MFRWRTPLVCGFAALTVVMAMFALRLRVDASFNKTLPLGHEFIRTFTKYQSEFGGANRVMVALMVESGDIFNEAYFKALKGATDSLRDVFFSNMSERAAKIMREDMESMGPVRLKDVDAAQMAMVQAAKDLAAKGEIMLAGSGGDDELIY